jgi:hypothetical protein
MILLLIRMKSVWVFPKRGFPQPDQQTTCQRDPNVTTRV